VFLEIGLAYFKIPLDPPLKRGKLKFPVLEKGGWGGFFTVTFAEAKTMHKKTKVGLLYKKTIKNRRSEATSTNLQSSIFNSQFTDKAGFMLCYDRLNLSGLEPCSI